jgi:DNA-binding NtrC family response regulator
MRCYPWPGNVRELENLIESGVILASPDEPVDVTELFPTLPGQPQVIVNAAGELERGAPSGSQALYDELIARGMTLDGLEDALIQEAVQRAGGNLAAAARALGLTRPQLSYRLQRVRERAKDF